MVVMKDTPADEYQRVMEYCMRHGFTLRFIETMPMGTPGRSGSAQYLSLKKVRQRLDRQYHLVPGLMTGGGLPDITGSMAPIFRSFYHADFATFLRNLQSGQDIG